MTVNSAFSTQITAQSASSGQGAGASGKAASGALPGGLAFFDLILANAEKAIDQQLQTLQTAQTAQTAASSDALKISAQFSSDALSLVNEEANLNISEALANTAYAADALGKTGEASGDTDISKALALILQKGDGTGETLQLPKDGGDAAELSTQSLQNAIISGDADLKPALNNLQRILQKLQTLAQNDSTSLIGTNITPEQITDLQKKVDDLLNGVTEDGKTEAEEFAGIFAGLIHILPPQAKPDAVIKGAGPVTIQPSGTEPSSGIPSEAGPSDDLAAKLNDLITGGTEAEAAPEKALKGLPAHAAAQAQAHAAASSQQTQTAEQAQAHPKTSDKAQNDDASGDDSPQGLPQADGDDAVKTDTSASLKTGKVSPRDAAMAAALQEKAQGGGSSADLSALKASLPFLFGDTSSYASGVYTTATPTGAEAYGAQITGLSALTQGVSAGNVLTQAPQAGLLHPGTQMVAVNLQKAGNAGQNSRITLQLDPPELGRVEIKMSFEKNSKIKAVLTVEKSETHAMLQKDSGVLERILQDAGLQTDDGSLSFELAKDGYAFGRDGQQDGGQGNQGRRADGDGSDEITQTTMNWAVDPQTGYMHYNILA